MWLHGCTAYLNVQTGVQVPETIPKVSPQTLLSWKNCSYTEVRPLFVFVFCFVLFFFVILPFPLQPSLKVKANADFVKPTTLETRF
jgi:hypothetical protein